MKNVTPVRYSNTIITRARTKRSSVVPLLAILLSHTTTFAFSSINSNTLGSNRIHDPTRMSLQMETDDLAVQANSYASANGIQVEKKRTDSNGNGNSDSNNGGDDSTTSTTFFEGAPMSLLPNAYPRAAFEQSRSVAPAFNELVDRVSRDPDFLEETLGGGVSSMDPYTAKILDLYRRVYVQSDSEAPARTADRLGIHRSDYMLHRDDNNGDDNNSSPYQLKQVELNTIASSFGGLSCKIANLHRYLTSRFEKETNEFLTANIEKVVGAEAAALSAQAPGVPYNPTLEELPLGFKVAYDRYVERFGSDSDSDGDSDENKSKGKKKPVVLFVVQEGETNTVDQRLLEFALWESHGIPVVRRSLTRLDSELSIGANGELLLASDNGSGSGSGNGSEVAVVYFRAGYAPTDYPDGDDGIEWNARLTLETSRATKCPCLGYHLAGTKKVQQELARPGVLERFFPNDSDANADKVAQMRACFAGLYSLGDDATEEDLGAVRRVLDGGQAGYVLKPQREGGGYNFYGDDLAEKLAQNVKVDDDDKASTTSPLSLSDELAEYILMQRLFPPQQTAILMRGGRVEGTGDSISELGAFGTLLCGPDGEVLHNQYAGFLLRTKFSNVDEGGVASGFATLSSPYLC